MMAAERGITLTLVATAAWVRSDPQLLRRVLMNFVSNAVRYTERGRIVIGVRRRDTRLHIQVWDSGPGIAERDRRAIFDEFRRGSDARGQGLGLGLAIAERTARLLGHPLQLRSWPSRGSVFSVSVPRAVTGRPEPVPASNIAESIAFPQGSALVLDNDAVVREAMRELLEGWGWRVHVAADIDAARAVMAESEVDLMLLDYHLDAGSTGLGAYDALASEVPAIVITADRSEAVREAVQSRGLLLLHKPLRPLALRSVMRRLGIQ